MEERLAKIEKKATVNQIILCIILAVLVIIAGSASFAAVKTVNAVKEYVPMVEKVKNLDFDALEDGIAACQKLTEADIDFDELQNYLSELESFSKDMDKFTALADELGEIGSLKDDIATLRELEKELPKMEEMADAIISINERLDRIGKFFGK